MEHGLPWFDERVKHTIEMTTPNKKVIEALIRTNSEASYYFELQKKGFIFKEL